jgi:hypothetical protein
LARTLGRSTHVAGPTFAQNQDEVEGLQTPGNGDIMRRFILLVTVVPFLLTPGVRGQGNQYDPKTVEVLKGEVASVESIARPGLPLGVRLMLKSEKETIPVHLGPAWYLENQDVRIVAGDQVEVTGSRIPFEGKPAVIAAVLKKGTDSLELRDDAGFPRWSGARRDRAESRPVGRRVRGGGRGGRWWSADSDYDRLFDPKTIATVSGEITSVSTFSPQGTGGRGVHVTLKTEKETISLHLGPEWYLENQSLKVAVGDKIEVTGSRVEFEGKPALIAIVVKKANDILELRDEAGFPRWSGWRRAGPESAPIRRGLREK